VRTDEVDEDALEDYNSVERLALRPEGRQQPEDEAAKEDAEHELADPELLWTDLLQGCHALACAQQS
jgi:hypothetical protein